MLSIWETLSLLDKIYWLVAIFSTSIFVILLILSFFGADSDSGDANLGEGLGGFLLSSKSLLAFLMMFGWSGVFSNLFGMSTFLSILISIIIGIIGLVSVSGILYFFTKMSHSGTMEITNAIGQVGEVILRVPMKKTGVGQVQINIQGSLRTLEAMTEEIEEIKSGTNIQVIDIINNNTLLVIPHR